MRRAVFLDRDGVITPEPPYYAHKIEQLDVVPGSAEAIRRLRQSGFAIIVVTNQAGIAHGYYGENDAAVFNQELKKRLAQAGAYIDAIYICPHHPEAEIEKYRVKCGCRKPEPGMLFKAAEEFGIDLKQSFMVGDKSSDIEAGEKAGCRTILVKTGQGKGVAKNNPVDCDYYIANDLLDAAKYIIEKSGTA